MAERKLPISEGKNRKINGKEITTCEILGPTIIDLVRAGMRPGMAAQAAGLTKQAVSKWIKRGSEEIWRIENGEDPIPLEEPYRKFVEDMTKAEAEAQGGLVLSWFREARAGDWKAAQAFLAKRWPDEWGDTNTMRLEVTGVNGGAIEATVKHTLEEDELKKRAVLEALVEAGELPSNVLGAWDGIIDAEVIDDNTGTTSPTNELEAAVRTEPATQPAPEADSVPDMDND